MFNLTLISVNQSPVSVRSEMDTYTSRKATGPVLTPAGRHIEEEVERTWNHQPSWTVFYHEDRTKTIGEQILRRYNCFPVSPIESCGQQYQKQHLDRVGEEHSLIPRQLTWVVVRLIGLIGGSSWKIIGITSDPSGNPKLHAVVILLDPKGDFKVFRRGLPRSQWSIIKSCEGRLKLPVPSPKYSIDGHSLSCRIWSCCTSR